jgi:medium-chain acyl-[acyl-carrier-protein] hydrolase
MGTHTSLADRANRAVVKFRQHPESALTLVCVPYAGLGASLFRPWAPLLPPAIDLWGIQLPGHESRIKEGLLEDSASVVDELTLSLLETLDGPYALFGASLGALLAFETARRLAELGRRPELLAVAACPAPSLHASERRAGRGSDRTQSAALDTMLASLQADHTPAVVIPALRDLVEPVIRADLAVYASYVYRSGRRLDCPIVGCAAVDDPLVPVELVSRWQCETSGDFLIRELPGDHFFVREHAERLVESLVPALVQAAAR